VLPEEAQQLFALTNKVREEQRLKPLQWDPSLASAALQHCLQMVRKGKISHQFEGEADLGARAEAAGAHFSLIAENVAVGPMPASIHLAWLNSPGHRANMLNPNEDHGAVAVVAMGDMMYAVADLSRSEEELSQTRVEAIFEGLLRAKGLEIFPDPSDARAHCSQADSTKGFAGNSGAVAVVRGEITDVSKLPDQVETMIAKGNYHKAAVGNCPLQSASGQFTLYRIAILFY
jgi:hypothetical protein